MKEKDLSIFYTVDDVTNVDDIVIVNELKQLNEQDLVLLKDNNIDKVLLAKVPDGDNYIFASMQRDPARDTVRCRHAAGKMSAAGKIDVLAESQTRRIIDM